MTNNYDDNLPLFINGDKPAVYVVDNKLIGLSLEKEISSSYIFTYNLIGKISSNFLTKTFLPEDFPFLKHKENFLNTKVFSPCIWGGIYVEDYHNKCLTSKMRVVKRNGEIVVSLFDLVLLDSKQIRGMYVTNLQNSIYLSVKDAFILFANLCLTSKGLRINDKETRSFSDSIDSIRKRIEQNYNEKTTDNAKLGKIWYAVDLFCIDYYDYLTTQINLKNISPEKILQLSGQIVLTIYLKKNPIIKEFIREKINLLINQYDNLTLNQKIKYYTLFLSAEEYGSIPEISNLYEENKSLLLKLEQELIKNFPINKEIERDKDEIYKEYLDKDFHSTLGIKKK